MFTSSMHVPKIIHQVWINDTHLDPNLKRGIPAEWQQSQAEWIRLHPDWQYILWDDARADAFLRRFYPDFVDFYYSYDYLIQRADALRYFVLNTFGGVYCDLDLYPAHNISRYLQGGAKNYFVMSAGSDVITNAFMVSSRNNPLMQKAIHSLAVARQAPPWYARGKHLQVMFTTGPNFLNDLVVNGDSEYTMLPRRLFYPYSSSENRMITDNFDSTVIRPLSGSGSWHSIDSAVYVFVNQNRPAFVVLGVLAAVCIVAALIYYIFLYKKTERYCTEVRQFCEEQCPVDRVPTSIRGFGSNQ